MSYACSRRQLSNSRRFIAILVESPLDHSGMINGLIFKKCLLFMVSYLGIKVRTRLEVKNITPSALKWDLNSGRKTGGIEFEFRSRKKMQKLPPTRIELVRPILLDCAVPKCYVLSCCLEIFCIHIQLTY